MPWEYTPQKHRPTSINCTRRWWFHPPVNSQQGIPGSTGKTPRRPWTTLTSHHLPPCSNHGSENPTMECTRTQQQNSPTNGGSHHRGHTYSCHSRNPMWTKLNYQHPWLPTTKDTLGGCQSRTTSARQDGHTTDQDAITCGVRRRDRASRSSGASR